MKQAFVKLKRPAEAIAQLEAARRLGPISWEAHYLLGEQLALAGRISEARPRFEQAIKVNPSFAMAPSKPGDGFV